jgi:hypothetical protein
MSSGTWWHGARRRSMQSGSKGDTRCSSQEVQSSGTNRLVASGSMALHAFDVRHKISWHLGSEVFPLGAPSRHHVRPTDRLACWRSSSQIARRLLTAHLSLSSCPRLLILCHHGGCLLQRQLWVRLLAVFESWRIADLCSYLEGIVRGYKNALLTNQNYSNLTQCETIDG